MHKMDNIEDEVIPYEPTSFLTERPNINPDSPRHFKNKRRRSSNMNSKLKRRPRSFNFIDGREEKNKKNARALKAYRSCDDESGKTQFTFEDDKCFNNKDNTPVKNTYECSKHKTLTTSTSNSSGFCDYTGTESENDTLSSDSSSIAATDSTKNESDGIPCEREQRSQSMLNNSNDSMTSLDDVRYGDSGIGNSVFTPDGRIEFTPKHTQSFIEKRRKISRALDKYYTSRQTRSKSIDICDSNILPKIRNRKISIEQCVEKLTLSSRSGSNSDKSKVRKSPSNVTEKKRRITVTLPLPRDCSVFSNIRIESVV